MKFSCYFSFNSTFEKKTYVGSLKTAKKMLENSLIPENVKQKYDEKHAQKLSKYFSDDNGGTMFDGKLFVVVGLIRKNELSSSICTNKK